MNEKCSPSEYIITANEGNAVALATGYHLSSGKIGAVYMQNSGLGNCVNPLTSLTDPEVYRIPMLLIIGWRGEPGVKDEPQHVKQGRITRGQLDLLEIPHWVLQADSDFDDILNKAFSAIKENNSPAALLVRKGTFSACGKKCDCDQTVRFLREQALDAILDLVGHDDLIISTTGKTSRELFELRSMRNETQHDFLTVGSMGHTSSIALGVALGNPGRRVLCLDGDGSAIMHMGALPIIGSLKPDNLIHVILNNCAHESVGGQPTVAGEMDFSAISRACGYQGYYLASNAETLQEAWQTIAQANGPQMVEIRISRGSREDLGRPSNTPEENKKAFMEAAYV
jgi:phosphonopyruvate decarboxylase